MAVYYSSTFVGTEAPLSESGHWLFTNNWTTALVKNTGAYASTSNCASRLTDGLTADQYAEIIYDQDPGASAWVGVMTRIVSPTNGSGYLAIAYDGMVRLYNAVDTGTIGFTPLDSASASLGTAPRRLRLTSVGTTHTVSFNGTDLIVHNDETYATGSAGIAASVFPSPTVKIQSFDGGDAVVAEVGLSIEALTALGAKASFSPLPGGAPLGGSW